MGSVLGGNRLLQRACSILVDALGQDQNHRHLGGQRADDLDVVALHSRLPRVDAIPGNVDDLVRTALPGVGDRLDVVSDDVLLRVPELDAGRVVDGHRHTGYVVALDVLGHRLAGALFGERNPEHGVDERALPDPGLSADEDVRVAEPLVRLLLLSAEVRRRIRRGFLDVLGFPAPPRRSRRPWRSGARARTRPGGPA